MGKKLTMRNGDVEGAPRDDQEDVDEDEEDDE